MENQRCPNCGATNVLDCYLRGVLNTSYGEFLGFLACLSCGQVWTTIAPAKIRAYVERTGSDLARQYLQAIEHGPAHDVPDCPEARQAAEGVAEIDHLVLGMRQHEAIRRYRELLGVKWDQAIYDVHCWHERSRVEKLAIFGWRSKELAAADDPRSKGHPLHDPLLDGV